MIHEVKSWTEHFDAITSGVKYFELRKNDRGYKVGDTVVLQEFRQHIGTYSGREQKIIITYMITDADLIGCDGLKEGWCIFGFERLHDTPGKTER